MLKGTVASSGIAIGEVYLFERSEIEIDYDKVEESETSKYKHCFEEALTKSKGQITELIESMEDGSQSSKCEILKSHLVMLEDNMLLEGILDKISHQRYKADAAVDLTLKELCCQFESIEDEYIKERLADIKDVCNRIICNIRNVRIPSLATLPKDSVIIASELTPSDTASIDKKNAIAFVTELGGKTSHVAIMAGLLEIPAIVGVKDITKGVHNGDYIIVDANEGIVIINPDEEQKKAYKRKKAEYEDLKKEYDKLINISCTTKDNKHVEISGNIGKPTDLDGVQKYGADGIGLFRTEFLYMDRGSLPDEEEQFVAYKMVAERMSGKPVIIRTLDIGGDKGLPSVNFDREDNPFLGWRAMRICLDRTDIFKTQLRALLRASIYGNILIMYPMISSRDEILEANKIMDEVKADLERDHIPYDKDIKIGIMVEIPSAAVMADVLIEEAEFFSIGTNDLTQYTLAVDRGNDKIASLYDHLHPAVLRLIKRAIDASHEGGKWTGVCGELAGDPVGALILLGLGLDEFSMTPYKIPVIKKVINSVSFDEMKTIAKEALKLSGGDEVKQYVLSKLDIPELHYYTN